jgi:hypothetical protein
MGNIITIQFQQSRLPRRLLNEGWWLQAPPVRSSVVAFPKRKRPKPKVRYLTLVTSGN